MAFLISSLFLFLLALFYFISSIASFLSAWFYFTLFFSIFHPILHYGERSLEAFADIQWIKKRDGRGSWSCSGNHAQKWKNCRVNFLIHSMELCNDQLPVQICSVLIIFMEMYHCSFCYVYSSFALSPPLDAPATSIRFNKIPWKHKHGAFWMTGFNWNCSRKISPPTQLSEKQY